MSPETVSAYPGVVVLTPKLPDVTYTPPVPIGVRLIPPLRFVAVIEFPEILKFPDVTPLVNGTRLPSEVVIVFPAVNRTFPFKSNCPVPDGLNSRSPVPEDLSTRFWFTSAVTVTLFETSVCKTF